MNFLHNAAVFLSAVGAINWGLVGAANFNLVEWLGGLVGAQDMFSKVVYILIGVAGVVLLLNYFGLLK